MRTQQVKQMLRELWKHAIYRFPEVESVSLKIERGIHDSPRHYACYYPDTRTIALAPEALRLRPSKVRGLLAHELGHAIVHQAGITPVKGYDACERQADSIAEKACDLKIYYDANGVQSAGIGARGDRPRPRGLR